MSRDTHTRRKAMQSRESDKYRIYRGRGPGRGGCGHAAGSEGFGKLLFPSLDSGYMEAYLILLSRLAMFCMLFFKYRILYNLCN